MMFIIKKASGGNVASFSTTLTCDDCGHQFPGSFPMSLDSGNVVTLPCPNKRPSEEGEEGEVECTGTAYGKPAEGMRYVHRDRPYGVRRR